MSFLTEPARPKRRTLCNVLRKSTNWKCLILTNLILSCLGAIIWCRNTRITKILVNFNAFPITSRRQVSPCEDGYVYIPIAFVIMLYLLYLVECWHSSARIQLSKKKVDVGSVYRKIHDMRESQPVIWWRAICYHYVRRVRQTTRRRNGETLTSSQTFYERVNSASRGSSFFYNACGMKDYSKDVADLERYATTKIKFSKGFVFANLATVSEFEEQRSTFFREQERLDDYMEMREGFEFPNIHFTENVMAWTRPESPPWFGRINTFWLASLLLLSWPLRICLELNTAHLHYKITKLFGVNYPSDTDLFELERPLVTSNYLQHILRLQQTTPRRLPAGRRHEFSHHRRNGNQSRSRTPTHTRTRTPTPTPRLPQNGLLGPDDNSSSSSSSASYSCTEPLLPPLPENAFTNRKEKSQAQCCDGDLEYGVSSVKNDAGSASGSGTLFGFGRWSQFTSSLSLFRRATGRNPFFPRSVTLMIEPSCGSGHDDAHAKRNYSFYSSLTAQNGNGNGEDDDEQELLVPSYSEALLLLEPNTSAKRAEEHGEDVDGPANTREEDERDNYGNDSQSPSPSPNPNSTNASTAATGANVNGHLPNDNESTCTYHQSLPSRERAPHPSASDLDRNRRHALISTAAAANDHRHEHEEFVREREEDSAVAVNEHEGLTTQRAAHGRRSNSSHSSDGSSSASASTSASILPAAVELDLTRPIVVVPHSDTRRGRAVAAAVVDRDRNSSLNATTAESSELVQAYDYYELPPSYIEALQTSRPVFISTLTRLRRCFTERDIAGGISSSHSHRSDWDRLQQSWLNYYARTNPSVSFLQTQAHSSGSSSSTSRRSITGIEPMRNQNQSSGESGLESEPGGSPSPSQV